MLQRFLNWWRRKRQERLESALFERHIVVAVTDAGISAQYPDGTIEAIAWDQVDCIAIETNDTGPWGADFWWLVEGSTRRCAYPQGATGETEAIRVLAERFPGFSYEAVADANCSTSNQRFVCWERKSVP